MTDRYYPKGYIPDVGALDSTYNEMNRMVTHPRSKYPPGYSGHEHGAKFKFGYSIPASSQLPKEPLDPEHPLVNFRAGKAVEYEPLGNRQIVLETADEKVSPPQPVYGEREIQKVSLIEETDLHASFVPQTSAFLASVKGNRGHRVDKKCPYTPAEYGRGTGFNSQSAFVSWLPPGKLEGSSTTKDAFTAPIEKRIGLQCLEYTVTRSPSASPKAACA